ncbi:IS3 family transposase [Actinoplanes sp. NPDC049802]|uniref:IS3 family transposase n=1 Tax=Actinoplanes sp. NPDC049802 TaxID=3154742 RepID=UPI0033EDDB97
MTGRYRFISEHAEVYGVTRLCRVLAVKRRQGYYEWLAAQPVRQARQDDDEQLAALIRQIQAEHRGYGSPRITAELRRRGLRVNRKRVERVMRERGLAGITRRRRRSLTKPDAKAAPAPDLIRRASPPPHPGCASLATSRTCPPPRAGCWMIDALMGSIICLGPSFVTVTLPD